MINLLSFYSSCTDAEEKVTHFSDRQQLFIVQNSMIYEGSSSSASGFAYQELKISLSLFGHFLRLIHEVQDFETDFMSHCKE